MRKKHNVMRRWSHYIRFVWRDAQRQQNVRQDGKPGAKPANEVTMLHLQKSAAEPKKPPTYPFPRCSSPSTRAAIVIDESLL
jgi:hypothetical protein